MNVFACPAYNNISVNFRIDDVIYMGVSIAGNGITLTLSPMQVKAIAQGLNNALARAKITDKQNASYFGEAIITYEEVNRRTDKETEDNPYEEKLEIEAESVEAFPLAGAA